MLMDQSLSLSLKKKKVKKCHLLKINSTSNHKHDSSKFMLVEI